MPPSSPFFCSFFLCHIQNVILILTVLRLMHFHPSLCASKMKKVKKQGSVLLDTTFNYLIFLLLLIKTCYMTILDTKVTDTECPKLDFFFTLQMQILFVEQLSLSQAGYQLWVIWRFYFNVFCCSISIYYIKCLD